jgi:flagellar assembly factor FliW
MELETKPFGKIEIKERQKIKFPKGILGFEHITEYALLNAKQWPFYWLQAIDVPDLAFILIDPKIFMTTGKFFLNKLKICFSLQS